MRGTKRKAERRRKNNKMREKAIEGRNVKKTATGEKKTRINRQNWEKLPANGKLKKLHRIFYTQKIRHSANDSHAHTFEGKTHFHTATIDCRNQNLLILLNENFSLNQHKIETKLFGWFL